MIVLAVAKTLPRYGSCGFSKVYELYHLCGIVKFLALTLSIQHPHTLRLKNTIVQLSQNSCFNSCYEAQYRNGLAHRIKGAREHEDHAMVL